MHAQYAANNQCIDVKFLKYMQFANGNESTKMLHSGCHGKEVFVCLPETEAEHYHEAEESVGLPNRLCQYS